jgi:hypothetical protein
MTSSDTVNHIDRPIFLVGSGRSGTTLVYHYLSINPELCWFSNATNRASWVPFMPFVNRLIDLPVIGESIQTDIVARTGGRLGLRPVEAEIIYERCGFDANRRMTEADYTVELERKFLSQIKRHQYWTGRKRFLSKQTSNNQHVRLINRVLPNALFIHLIRDGRAVANSVLTQGWIDEIYMWWLQDYARNRVQDYRDPIELSGLHWLNNVRELRSSADMLGDRYIEVRYEEMITDYAGVLSRLCDFCGIEVSRRHLELLPAPRKSLDNKWRSELTPAQIEILNDAIGEELTNLGYAV